MPQVLVFAGFGPFCSSFCRPVSSLRAMNNGQEPAAEGAAERFAAPPQREPGVNRLSRRSGKIWENIGIGVWGV